TSTNAGASNVQIVASDDAHMMALQIEGADGDKGGRFLYKEDFDLLWAGRTTGNDIIELELDIYTGPATTSRNTFGAYIYNAAFQVLGGVAVRASTKELLLVAYSQPAGTTTPANYNYNLAAAPGIILAADSWNRVGVSYNKTTGAVTIKGPGIAAAGVGVTSAASGANTDPAEIDIVSNAGSAAAPNTNTSSAIMLLDNIVARASATDTLLGNKNVTATTSFSVFPNPATNLINVASADALVNGVEIIDLNGRTVKSAKFDGVSEAQLNISDLSSGIYMMTVASDKGTTTKKIVKN
ncbi:MAG: T9SS type A sorting domain-containing protein, partial [Pedobacter sp.]